MHFQVINARIPQTTATPMQTARAMLLKSKKPLPVPVIAQAIAKMVMRTKTMLTIFKTLVQMHLQNFVNHLQILQDESHHKLHGVLGWQVATKTYFRQNNISLM